MSGSTSTAHAQRLALAQVAPELYKAQLGMDTAVRRSGIEPAMYELVKIRASQLNGCAYCLDMHTKDATAMGETAQRIHLLPAWREAPCYNERERAALALTEAVTLIAADHVPDDVWADAAAVFTQEELAAVLFGIITINGWNRIAIATNSPVGDYVSPHKPRTAAAVV